MNQPDMRVAIVTGASSGIGAATARMLAAEGFHVVAAARSVDKLEAMRAERIEPLALDVTEPASIAAAVAHVRSSRGRIDVLVNNAGYGAFGLVEGMPLEAARRQFDVNVFGAMEMVKAVLPIMRSQRSGRIIQLASVVSHISLPVIGWYAASKHAIKALMDALRLEVKQFGIHVVLIEPGAIATGFENTAFAELAGTEIPPDYKPLVESFSNLMHDAYEGCPGPELVVAAIRKAVTSPHPRAAYTDRMSTRLNITAKHLLSDRLFDWGLSYGLRR
jgi:NAD(P)-dependent dehydrogenase (short-subunit alcohol dehydrogenase family)